jgi:protein-S-isoprenylcysteine O-methyltransferase Ste14
MALQEEFVRSGEYFFRWRSYLPLVMAFFFIPAVARFRVPFDNGSLNLAWDLGCLGVSLGGEFLRFFTVGFVPRGTSGRNTLGQVADTLNTTGMYAVVRNPLYLGNFIIWLGLSLFIKSLWFTSIIILFFAIYYERIIFAEESFLREKFGDTFVKWAEVTPAMVPRLKNWQPPALPFSWKSALKREYGGFFAIIATLTVLELLDGLFHRGVSSLNPLWLKLFVVCGLLYLGIRYLKKKTQVLATDR